MQVCLLSLPSGKTHCSYVCSCRESGGSTVIVCSQEHSCCLTFYQGTDLELWLSTSQKQVKREEMRKHIILRYNLLQVWRAIFVTSVMYISNFTESAIGLILKLSTWKMIRYRQEKFLGKGRQCILISHYFIQGQMETNVYTFFWHLKHSILFAVTKTVKANMWQTC